MKLGHVLKLPLDTSVSKLLLGLIGREAQTAEFGGALSQEGFTAMPLDAPKAQVLMEVREQLPRSERMRTHLEKHNPN